MSCLIYFAAIKRQNNNFFLNFSRTADAFLSQLDISHVQPAMRTTNKKKLFWASLCVIAILFLVGLSLYRVYLNKLADEGYFEPPVYHLTPAEARTFDPDEYFPGD